MRHDSFGQIGIERRKWLEYFGAARWMRPNFATLLQVELAMIVDNVEQRFVELPDVVKEGDALHGVASVEVGTHRVGEDQSVARDSTYVSTCNRVIRVDSVEKGLECRGA